MHLLGHGVRLRAGCACQDDETPAERARATRMPTEVRERRLTGGMMLHPMTCRHCLVASMPDARDHDLPSLEYTG